MSRQYTWARQNLMWDDSIKLYRLPFLNMQPELEGFPHDSDLYKELIKIGELVRAEL